MHYSTAINQYLEIKVHYNLICLITFSKKVTLFNILPSFNLLKFFEYFCCKKSYLCWNFGYNHTLNIFYIAKHRL